MTETRNPYFTTVSGREVDLVAPSPADVSFEDLAHHLSHLTRYGGACAITYTVAQHLVLGVDLCTEAAKPYWLAHDAHEGIGGDDVTPKKRARPHHLRKHLLQFFPLSDVERVLDAMKSADAAFEASLMEAVHLAAGLAWPVPFEIEQEIKQIDRVMLLTEWKALMPGAVPPAYRFLDGAEIKAKSVREVPISEWSRQQSRELLMTAFVKHLPIYANRKGGK